MNDWINAGREFLGMPFDGFDPWLILELIYDGSVTMPYS